jgi:sulfotransferase family protein
LPETNGPIFIVSAMGSGSTLIRLILDSHPRIGIPQETGFMRAYQAHQFIPLKWSGRNWARRMGWTRAELDAELAAFYDRIFRRYIERQGKHRWGDKTPLHTWHVDGLARLYPDASFIGMMRHPGGSVGSNMTRFGHPFGRAVHHVERYDREIARQAAAHKDRFVIVRYEDLVLRPEPLLRELLDWLGEPWSDQVLKHNEVQTAKSGGKVVVEGTNRIDDPIDVSRVAKWHGRMNELHRRSLASRIGRLTEFFGYDMDDPAVLAPLRDDGRLLIAGADIDARIDAYPDLDLREKGEPGLAERHYHPGRVQLHGIGEFARKAAPPPEPPFHVRLWRVLPLPVRQRFHPLGRRLRRRLRNLRRRLRR